MGEANAGVMRVTGTKFEASPSNERRKLANQMSPTSVQGITAKHIVIRGEHESDNHEVVASSLG